MSNTGKVWLITGASRGLGHAFAAAALERGDRVAATARQLDTLAPFVERYGEAFLALQLDVTDRAAATHTVQAAHAHFGRLDVVVNNAGYTLFSFVEEASEAEVRGQLEANFFGTLWVTQAAIPLLRDQGSGHIVQISSSSGVTAFPPTGLFSTSKWATEGMSEALAMELAPFGVKVTVIEPGPYDTDTRDSSAAHSQPQLQYDAMRQMMAEQTSPILPGGDPAVAARALMRVVDEENPPARVLFGGGAFDLVVGVTAQRLQTWRDWESLSRES